MAIYKETQIATQETRIPVNTEPLAYFRKLLQESSAGFAEILGTDRKLVICTQTYRQTGGRVVIRPHNSWEGWEEEELQVFVCIPPLIAQRVATVSHAVQDCQVAFFLKPFVDENGRAARVLCRDNMSTDVPLVGKISGSQNHKEESPLEAVLYLRKEDAERAGLELMNFAKSARGEK